MGHAKIAEVIVDLHAPDVDRLFHYAVPPALAEGIQTGRRVLVPFGRRAAMEGYVVGLVDESPHESLKPILRCLDEEPILTEEDLRVARWLQERYLCPLVQAVQAFLPPGSRLRGGRVAQPRRETRYRVADRDQVSRFLHDLQAKAPKQAAVLRVLLKENRPLTAAQILNEALATRSPLESLVDKGLVERVEQTVIRTSLNDPVTIKEPLALNLEQKSALERIVAALDEHGPRRVLLEGVTGSGKTEVYLQAIDAALRRKMGAILLVPEIALTPQTIASFHERFGDQVAALHSKLSLGERYDQWWRLRRGEATIAVGARSAVFAPVRRLGIIIVDEEHETSYKQEESPRYHARSVAWARVQEAGGVLVLGSATPSLESRTSAESGNVIHLRLKARVDGKPLPKVDIVDMRQELLQGNRSMFSRRLQERLDETFRRGEQALLFINRRGFASFLLCRSCGHVPKCDACEVSLTLHDSNDLRCHYCDAHRSVPEQCPICQGPYLRPFGGGTQRVEAELKRLFPNARALRMDVDTTARQGAHARILTAFSRGEADALIGTQMIAKGLHFPQVTLVGVVSADVGLHFPDFRAAERTFHLLTQVAGRAGRGEREGAVVFQTYAPDHYAIEAASRHDYDAFFALEREYRRRVGYPPFGALVRCVWSGEEEEAVIRRADRLSSMLQPFLSDPGLEMLGPSPAPISKLRSRFRWHLLLRGRTELVASAARRLKEMDEAEPSADVRLAIDVDPVALL